ncbi:UNVERIFIED_CONTAM: hypothetical protein O1L42_23960, partial [Pseudomonas aeruginosa]
MYGAVETRNPPESGLKWCPPKIGAHHAAIWKKRGDGFGGRLRMKPKQLHMDEMFSVMNWTGWGEEMMESSLVKINKKGAC